MRIRKRQAPFLPLSSLSPIPISSDPQSNGSPAVQLHHGHDPHQNLSQQADASCSQPSDHPNQSIGSSKGSLDQKDKDCLVLLEEGDYEEEEEESNDSRKNSVLGAEIAAAGVLSQLSNVVVKEFPLKKRRRDNDEKKMKSKMNKKLDDNEQQQQEEEEQSETKGSVGDNSSKKRARGGGAIMEGSRCSRVNGRGWRCCQQTLVGYSLCEHHLGKGRLRSMDSVRSRSLGTSKLALSSSSSTFEGSKMKQELVSSVNEDDDQKPLMIANKKRMKLGMVKARSISSLLGQKDNEIIAADSD